ncbi:MAG: hypothetical protein JWL61_3460 [Gemmatimonadetes bacterium]|nr:hypothetical protein [Gemmatimonadota bacterium]
MRVLLVLSVLLTVSAPARAQRGAKPTAQSQPMSFVSGRVELPGGNTTTPVPGVYVTLHRVGTDSSGPVDSVRTDAGGNYMIRYSRPIGDEAVYFAAAVYRGIAYFSTPIQSARVSGEEGAITVFDTTSKPINLTVRGHHVVVSAPRPDGSRDVVEVWELSNDTTVTVVGRDTLAPVWTTLLPKGATSMRAGQGDVSADAIVARGNRVAMLAPFGPGVKQVSYSYSVPSSSFPLSVSIDKPTTVLEVLVEEPLAQVTGSTLRATDAAVTSGRTFKRFLGQDAPPGESVLITVPVTSAATRTRVLAVLAGAIALIMVGALARTLMRRGARVPAARPVLETTSLVAAIAALDARHERGDPTLDANAYATDRAALKAKLAQALAAGEALV